ncbi:hypothetical protein M2451_002632 [Dysgonomonas sp. PFB1-18]|uniref:hypothetical protein n=1 Tax=unclassified Dysgonomonas TaxID=2630389 RepID=UPI002473F4A8|nr:MULTISPECIES: hypothetical protein [unclassified Dysgonomonas]MDH6308113.1 hypothetical protein [Dysgonomonas sp. PF1-14]MDH6339652.1 hypothetical protein [Dysgonomonas sp. PF1-16]MDH6381303.1 hypothetical protein [Dysgonomonas sp. PFB1-18]MDH6398515.1 hypothetical protein [Dysgonomonas sp. PF1-23]
MGILAVIQQTLDEQGNGAKLLGTSKRVLESTAQAKYNDTRKVERNYTRGVHSANTEVNKINATIEGAYQAGFEPSREGLNLEELHTEALEYLTRGDY